jgi:hypothetical protein
MMKSHMVEWLATKTPAGRPGRGVGRRPWMRMTPDQDVTNAVASSWMRLRAQEGVSGRRAHARRRRVTYRYCILQSFPCVSGNHGGRCLKCNASPAHRRHRRATTHAISMRLVSVNMDSSLTGGNSSPTVTKPSASASARSGKSRP